MKNTRKRFTALICALVLTVFAFSDITALAAEDDEEFKVQLMGDVDDNGVVDLEDVRLCMRIVGELADGTGYRADVDQNGTVDLRDARTALMIVIGIIKPLDKTGENLISQDADNEFIALISQKYKIDSRALVAIYAVPDKGNNFVLQFKKRGDSYSRSTKDLEKVYQVDIDKNICIATKTGLGASGVSTAESIIVFAMVKGVIMPQHPDVFTDI